MRKIRYLSALVLTLLCGVSALGQDEFNPTSPSEPGAPPTRLVLLANPTDGGSVSGAGRYVPEKSVNVYAYAKTNFKFVNWTDTKGNVVSTTSSFSFTKTTNSDTLVAHFEFSPGSPAEPVPGTQLVYYRLTTTADDGGSASGGGRYREGTSVSLYAYPDSRYDFVNWTNEAGEVVSTQQRFSYTTKAEAETLTAHFAFNPSSPGEPSDPILRHKVKVECTEGGTVGNYSNVVFCGNTFTLYAYPSPGYAFLGWYLGGELYTTLTTFTYTMGDTDLNFEARFEFNPDSPSEPAKPSTKQYAFYLMSEITYPGTLIDCPVYLTTLDTLRDMTFQLTFPEQALPDWSTLELGDKAQGYTVSYAETDTAHVYRLSLIGGKLAPGNTQLLNIKVNVPDTVAYGTSHAVKINQVSVTQNDGTSVTASTRNGRVYVYKLGDTNGDGIVDIADKVNVVFNSVGKDIKDFISEVSDVNEDGTIDIADAVGIIQIILNK